MIYSIAREGYPLYLQNIHNPPRQLFIHSNNADDFQALMKRKRVAIVGTRKATAYGRSVTDKLAKELASHGVVIISGLAIGIDAIAHRAALEVGGSTLAVLPSPVESIQPRVHTQLAQQILDNGGVIVSEYPAGSPIYKPNFVNRNRIVAGLADVLLITEAAENSGTLHTARFALDQGSTVMAVPGSIYSPESAGTNNLLRDSAMPATSAKDVLHALGMRVKYASGNPRVISDNPQEQQILDLLRQGISSGSQLLEASGFSIQQFNSHLTMLEITAKIRALGGNYWALA